MTFLEESFDFFVQRGFHLFRQVRRRFGFLSGNAFNAGVLIPLDGGCQIVAMTSVDIMLCGRRMYGGRNTNAAGRQSKICGDTGPSGNPMSWYWIIKGGVPPAQAQFVQILLVRDRTHIHFTRK